MLQIYLFRILQKLAFMYNDRDTLQTGHGYYENVYLRHFYFTLVIIKSSIFFIINFHKTRQ